MRTPQPYLRGELVVVVDVADLDRAAAFWTQVLGYVRPPTTGDRYLALVPADGAGIEILLQRVHDPKQGKNRLHFDLRTPDLTAEVTRVRDLGATLLTSEPIQEHGWTWHILTDPDDNEFCILQPPG